MSDYDGEQGGYAIAPWVMKKTGAGLKHLGSAEAVNAFLGANEIAAIFFGDLDSDEGRNFIAVEKRQIGLFYGATNDAAVIAEYDVKAPALVLVKQIDDKRVDFTGNLASLDEVNRFLTAN